VTNGGVGGECASATGGICSGTAGVARFPALADATAANSADTFDAVVFLEGVNDIRAGVAPGSVGFVFRDMVARARDRKIVIVMTKFENVLVGGLDAGQIKALGDALWAVTEDTSLAVEIYRQSLFDVQTSGNFPTQSGYDRMAQLIFEKVAREFPLQPCDARADKPGKGCPRNP
jgi:hypothetical protein